MSVCTLSAIQTLREIVQAILPRGASTPEGEPWRAGEVPVRALYISLDLQVYSHFDDGDEIRESAIVHLVFARPSNYTKVWSVVNSSGFLPEPEAFTMTSDHDSCWATDGLQDVNQTYLDLLGKVRSQTDTRPDAGSPKDFNGIHAIETIQVTWANDPEDKRDYRKLLTSIHKGA
jgi:hypothetical protein